jgi:hypothetical protein
MIKAIFAGLLLLMSASSLEAQDFPATEKEVKEILCSGIWSIDSLGRPGKMRTAAEVKMEGTTLTFREDGTYTISVFGKDKAGKWTLALPDKRVNMYENRKDPDGIITGLTREHLVMGRGDGSDIKMIFRQDK